MRFRIPLPDGIDTETILRIEEIITIVMTLAAFSLTLGLENHESNWITAQLIKSVGMAGAGIIALSMIRLCYWIIVEYSSTYPKITMGLGTVPVVASVADLYANLQFHKAVNPTIQSAAYDAMWIVVAAAILIYGFEAVPKPDFDKVTPIALSGIILLSLPATAVAAPQSSPMQNQDVDITQTTQIFTTDDGFAENFENYEESASSPGNWTAGTINASGIQGQSLELQSSSAKYDAENLNWTDFTIIAEVKSLGGTPDVQLNQPGRNNVIVAQGNGYVKVEEGGSLTGSQNLDLSALPDTKKINITGDNGTVTFRFSDPDDPSNNVSYTVSGVQTDYDHPLYLDSGTGDAIFDNIRAGPQGDVPSVFGKSEVSGTVQTASGAPVSNATVRVVGLNENNIQAQQQTVQEEIRDINERINNSLPKSWDPSLPLPGQDGFKQDVLSSDSGKYVAVHSPDDWPTRKLSSPTIHPRVGDEETTTVALSVWAGNNNPLYQDNVDKQLPGVVVDGTNIVVEELGPGGSTLSSQTVKTDEAVSELLYNAHEYGTVTLSTGAYKIYPKGIPQNSYTILVGAKEQIKQLLSEGLRDYRGQLSERSQYLANLSSDGVLESYDTSTGPNGKFSINLPNAVTELRLQAYKIPGSLKQNSSVSLSTPPKPDEVQQLIAESDSFASVFYGTSPKTVEAPASGVEVRVKKTLSFPGANNNITGKYQALSDYLSETPRVSLVSGLDTETAREAIETHQDLRDIVETTQSVETAYCRLAPRCDGGDAPNASGVGKLSTYQLSDAPSINETELQEIQRENQLMTDAIAQADPSSSGGGGADLPGLGDDGIEMPDTEVPETLTQTLDDIGVQLDGLGDVTVTAVYDGASNVSVPTDNLELLQHFDNNNSAIKVVDWEVPSQGVPDRFRVDFASDQETVVEDPTETIQVINRTIRYSDGSLSNLSDWTVEWASQDQIDKWALGEIDDPFEPVPDSKVSQVNSTHVRVSGWDRPDGVENLKLGINPLSSTPTNETDVETPDNVINRTVNVGRDISDDGDWTLSGVMALYEDGSEDPVPARYISLKNSTAYRVDGYEIQSNKTLDKLDGNVLSADDALIDITDPNATSVSATVSVPNRNLSNWTVSTVQAAYNDGSTDLVASKYYSVVDKDTLNVTAYPLPDDKTGVANFLVDLEQTVTKSYSASTPFSGTVNTSFQLDKNGPTDPGVTATKVEITNASGDTFTVGYSDLTDPNTWTINGTAVEITDWDENGTSTVSSVDVALNEYNPEKSEDITDSRTYDAVVSLSKNISSASNFALDSLEAVYNDGGRDVIGDQYISTKNDTAVEVSGWPVPTGKEVAGVVPSFQDTSSATNESVNESAQDLVHNTTIDVTEYDLLNATTVVEGVTLELASGQEIPVGSEHWSIVDASTIDVTEAPVPANVTITNATATVGLRSAISGEETRNVSYSDRIEGTWTLDNETSDSALSVFAKFGNGNQTLIPSTSWSLGQYGNEVTIDWPVPDNQTVSSLRFVDAPDAPSETVQVGNGNVSETVDKTVSLPTTANASDVSVTAVLENGSTTSVPTSVWSLSSDGKRVVVENWTPSYANTSVKSIRANVTGVDSVSQNVTQSRWLTAEFPIQGGIGGSDVDREDVSVLVHFASGTTRTMDSSYWSTEDTTIGRDDTIQINDWPVPQDKRVTELEIVAATGDEVDSITRPITNPTAWGYSTELPELASLQANTQYPSTGTAIRFSVAGVTPSAFGDVQDVTVLDPESQSVNWTKPTDQTVQFIPSQTGTYTVKISYGPNENATATETLTFDVTDRAIPAPPTLRAEKGPTGLYPVVSDGLPNGDLKVTDEGNIDVQAQLGRSQSTPATMDVYLTRSESETDGEITLDLVRGPAKQAVKQQVSVRVHTSALSDEAHVWRNGDPLEVGDSETGNISFGERGTTITTTTDAEGDLELRINNDPGIVDQIDYEIQALINGIDIPVVWMFLPLLDLLALVAAVLRLELLLAIAGGIVLF